MPMNRHMTWGDRQAEDARDKNLKKLRKLAEKAGAPAAQNTGTVDVPANASPHTKGAEAPKSTPAAPNAARPAAKATSKGPPKKAAPAKTAKKTKK